MMPFLIAMAFLAAPATGQDVPKEWTGAMQPDPKCLADVAWEVDPTAAPMRLYGCRPLSDIPAPDANGWVTYTRPLVNGQDGGSLQVKLIAQPSVTSWKFEVIDMTGGSGAFGYMVEGEADDQGYIQHPKVTIMNSAN